MRGAEPPAEGAGRNIVRPGGRLPPLILMETHTEGAAEFKDLGVADDAGKGEEFFAGSVVFAVGITADDVEEASFDRGLEEF